MNELDYIRTCLGRDDFYLGTLLDRLEAERQQLTSEAQRLREANQRLLAENEQFREEIAVARLSRKLGLFASRVNRPTKKVGHTPSEAGGSTPKREAAGFYRRLPASFTFSEFIQAAEAVGFGQRRAKTILLALLREGTLRLNGAQIERVGRPAAPLRRAG